MHREIHFLAKLFQQCHIAPSFVAESEITPDAKALDPAEVAREAADEFFAGLFAERFVEMESGATPSAPSDSMARNFCGSE